MLNKDYSGIEDNDGFLYIGWQNFRADVISMYFLNETTTKSAVLNIPKGLFNNLVSTAENKGFKKTVLQMFDMLKDCANKEIANLMIENYKEMPAHLFNQPFASFCADKITKMLAKTYCADQISLNEFRHQADVIEKATLDKQNEAKSIEK